MAADVFANCQTPRFECRAPSVLVRNTGLQLEAFSSRFALFEVCRRVRATCCRHPIGLGDDQRARSGCHWRTCEKPLRSVATVFTLARFSEAFLILRAQSVGLPIMLVPAVMVLMNIVYALAAYPAGVISDRIDRRSVLIAGLMLLVLADIALALASGIAGVAVGVILWACIWD